MSHDFDEVRDVVLGMVERCSQCGGRHRPENLQMVGRSRTMWAFRLTCPTCGAQSFIAAVVGDQPYEEEAVGSQPGPVRGAGTAPTPITEDDVIAMRRFLEHFNGDFKSLFSRGSRGSA